MYPEKHIVIPLDLEKYLDVEENISALLEEHPVDILINNAGISHRYKVVDSSITLDKKIMDINFFGAVAMTRPILKKMLLHNRGHIVVISSMLGLYGIQTRSAYSASKHALRGYFECLRNELFNTDVHITLVYPGYINTPISKNALLANGTSLGVMDKSHQKAIPVTEFAKKIIQAIYKQKATLVVSGFKERCGAFMARFFPGLFRYLSPRFKV
jgi:short-subunit dehydrogenase